MKTSHRSAAIAIREARRVVAVAAMRAAQAKTARSTPSFRPLTDAEAEAMLGGELLAALSGAPRRA